MFSSHWHRLRNIVFACLCPIPATCMFDTPRSQDLASPLLNSISKLLGFISSGMQSPLWISRQTHGPNPNALVIVATAGLSWSIEPTLCSGLALPTAECSLLKQPLRGPGRAVVTVGLMGRGKPCGLNMATQKPVCPLWRRPLPLPAPLSQLATTLP